MRAFLFCLAAICGLGLSGAGLAQSGDLTGPWRGVWTNANRQYEYRAELTLESDASGRVEGAILWTLVRSPRASEQQRLGLSATEYVAGRYEPASGALLLTGTHKDDPHNIIGLDAYRLIVSGDGRQIVGMTYNDGAWGGRIDLSR